MIVSHDGYIIEHHRSRNQDADCIVITVQTPTSTTNEVNFTAEDLMILLELTKYLCER